MRNRLKSGTKHEALLNGEGKFCQVAAALIGTAVVGGIMAPDAPDPNEGMAMSAAANERVGMAQVALAERTQAASEARNARLDAVTGQVTAAQLAAMEKNAALADDYDQYNKETYRPLEKSLVAEAINTDTPEAQAAAAAAAGADVQRSIAGQRASTGREMARMGVNPNSGRSEALNNSMTLNAAVAEAGAENSARSKVKDLGFARRMDAASLGRGLTSSQATSTGLALNAGNSAVANNANAVNAGNQTAGTVSNIYGGATSAINGSSYSSNQAAAQAASIYGVQAGQHSAMMGGIGSGIGMAYAKK